MLLRRAAATTAGGGGGGKQRSSSTSSNNPDKLLKKGPTRCIQLMFLLGLSVILYFAISILLRNNNMSTTSSSQQQQQNNKNNLLRFVVEQEEIRLVGGPADVYATELVACGVSVEKMNDDFCDCPNDGSDEPKTSACSPIGMFTCIGEDGISTTMRIPSSKVKDGVIDCPDGADEV